MKKYNVLHSQAVVLDINNIDTDQIIPARYLATIDKQGLADCLFADWRASPNFELNQPTARKANILLTGKNFGCGSSREHAVWALMSFGFQAVIAKSFSDIFRNNALKNGLLPIVLPPAFHTSLVQICLREPSTTISIDLEKQTVTIPCSVSSEELCIILPENQQADFQIDAFSKRCFLQGINELGYLLGLEREIKKYESQRESNRERPASQSKRFRQLVSKIIDWMTFR